MEKNKKEIEGTKLYIKKLEVSYKTNLKILEIQLRAIKKRETKTIKIREKFEKIKKIEKNKKIKKQAEEIVELNLDIVSLLRKIGEGAECYAILVKSLISQAEYTLRLLTEK